MGELVGVLLAAGRGERFGGDKGLAMLPDGIPMAVRSALNLRAVLVHVVCVVRPGDVALCDLLSEHGFEVVVAADAALGMSASLQAGINATPDAAGWMVALADMPLIRLETYQRLVAAFVGERRIVVPCITAGALNREVFNTKNAGLPSPLCGDKGAKSGHPVTFPARYKSDLLALQGDKGAKSILQQHAANMQRVWVEDPGILQDFDTREAFKRLFI